jgi:thioredoxin-dependent peroxiredoxin
MELFGIPARYKAPSFSAQATTGQTVRLEDFRGRYLVLYFYPKSFTPGCTHETILFRDHHVQLDELRADVLGVSRDTHVVQCEFAKRYEVQFPIIGDPDGEICRSYAVDRRVWPVAKRVTFLIDPEGFVVGRFSHELRIAAHLSDVLDALRKLHASGKPPEVEPSGTSRTRRS